MYMYKIMESILMGSPYQIITNLKTITELLVYYY